MHMLVALGSMLGLTASPAFASSGCSPTIVDLGIATDSLSTLVDLVVAADLADTLSGSGPFTVFAPTDEAFAALPTEVVDYLLENVDELVKVLTYHVVAGAVFAEDLEDGSRVETLEGSKVDVTTHPYIKINDSFVIAADIEACNGVVHVIDMVLIPPTLSLPGSGRDGYVFNPGNGGQCVPTNSYTSPSGCLCNCGCCIEGYTGYAHEPLFECGCGCHC